MQKVHEVSVWTRVRGVFVATHFLPSVLVMTMTAVLAYGSGQRKSLFWLILTVLLGQFSVGWSNDYIDRNRDKLANRQEKPIVSGLVQAATIRNLAIAAGLLSIVFSLLYSPTATPVYLVALGSAYWYDIQLKSTVLSVGTFIVSFGLLPVYVGLGAQPPFFPNAWIIAAAVLWSIGIHIQNVVPDFEADKKTGIKGAINYLTMTQAVWLTGAMLILSASAVAMSFGGQESLFPWVALVVFAAATVLFVANLFMKKEQVAFKITFAMTGISSILIMCSGWFMRL